MLERMFPETIFVRRWTMEKGVSKAFTKQLSIVSEELLEAQDAFSRIQNDHAIEELVDVMQATYTAMRMIPGYTPEKVNKAVEDMIKKNQDRNYYV